ncbi:MAG TPA: serine/threonine-protein kinase [Pirellulales bacterium]|nr:serine/threonine-protein kinase [Pirellulales bacterium]
MNDALRTDDDRIEALVAEAADAYLECVDRGERPDVVEFASRYPAIARILRDLLPAVCSIHDSSAGVAPPAPAALSSPEIDGRLGDFRLQREVGRGGMGVVYEAVQISLGRRVALKVLPMAAALDPRQLQRFRLEAQAAAHLHHSHIVPIYSVGCERGVYYYAMQFIEGRTLAEVIDQRRRQSSKLGRGRLDDCSATTDMPGACDWPANARAVETCPNARATAATVSLEPGPLEQDRTHLRSAALLGIQAAAALEHAHTMGVIHRDIKPANLLLDVESNLYVTDFGLARLQDSPGITLTGDVAGTLRYMSPEQALAQHGLVDHRTDIYSLGVTLYELLTLTPAFDAPNRHAILRQISQDEPVAPRKRNPAIPLDLETIILKAMAKEPERRYATAKALADDLQRFLEHRPIQARRPTLVESAAKWSRRHRGLVAAGVGTLLVATLGLAVSTALIAREQWKTQTAYDQLSAEQQRTRAAFDAEAKQRANAEKSFRQARQIVDFFIEVGEQELADKPELQDLRRVLLASALDYYQDFIEQARDDSSLQSQLSQTHLHVASILEEIGTQAEALAALERARQLQERLVRSHPTAPEFQRGLRTVYRRFGALRGGRELFLLSNDSVQADLQLASEQIEAIAQLQHKRDACFDGHCDLHPEEFEAKFDELRMQEQALADLLTVEQQTRLKQIGLQQRGRFPFTDPEIVGALGLSPEQQEAIRQLKEETIRTSYRLGEEERKQIKQAWSKTWQNMLGVLKDEQAARWKELIGEPFDGELRPSRGGPPGRGGPHGGPPPHDGPRPGRG